MGKIRTTITIDEDVYKKLTTMSAREERSVSQQISFLIRKGEEKETPKDFSKCLCENELIHGVDCLEQDTTLWTCMFCGRSEVVKDCGCNHMFYDCPYCGEHLT